ncbi:MAG TPA: SpoIID/LytB domain-containing protein [Thermoleophilaceae bacterium]|nr:SpoIID/LytB domain-containing protein [Thermoleophilaceae bacterium]
MRRFLLTAVAVLLFTPAAEAATSHVVRGRGNGHGVGMSQYGAYGYAQHGRVYGDILGHYYTGTRIERTGSIRVRVLLLASLRSVRFRGASRLAGVRALDRRATYAVRPSGGLLGLFRGGKLRGRYRMLSVYRSGGSVRLLGRSAGGVRNGRFRGSIDLRPGASGGVTAVNRVKLDHYVRGVVAGEMPSSWHPETLKAQAVAARTYALATRKRGGVFDLYPDARSQVYRGVVGETRATGAAVRATARQVVTYRGAPITTYYFSTSGGRTENVENSFLGSDPQPFLKGVVDPYDDIAPRHTWRFRFTTGQMDASLGSYSPGRFRMIKVLERGVSPRIVRARVYGTGGTKIITGPTLRSRLGLYDTWASFTTVSTSQLRYSSAWTAVLGARSLPLTLTGTFRPAPRGRRLVAERRSRGHWADVATTRTGPGGSYVMNVPRPGVYRVRSGSVAGPAVRVR